MRKIQHLDGVKLGGINYNNLRYADDTVILAESEEQLQKIMEIVVEESKQAGLDINQRKSFTMVISKQKEVLKCAIQIEGNVLKQVETFVYMWSTITSNRKSEKEILRKIGIAKTAFRSLTNVLSSKNININTKLRLLKCYV